MAEYRIDELARLAGLTTRNVRAYQERGLLPPPTLRGRTGIYHDAHLARLRMIGQLLARGYTSAVIGDLLSAWERGRDLSDLLGLEKVLTDSWSNEQPVRLTGAELLEMFRLDPAIDDVAELLRLSIENHFVEPDGDLFLIPSPKLLRVGAELVAAGIPLPEVFAVTAEIRVDCTLVARRFVNLASTYGGLNFDDVTSAEDVSRIVDYILRLRPLAFQSVEGLLAQCMEAEVRRRVGDEMARGIQQAVAADSPASPLPDESIARPRADAT